MALKEKDNLKYYTFTMGCQMNVYDTEVLAGHLENMGYVNTGDPAEADIFIINTCAVRQKAEEKVYSRLGRLKSLKENNPHQVMVLWGCMVQQEGLAENIAQRFPFIDMICGPNALERFPWLLEKALFSSKTVIDTGEEGEREVLPVNRKENVSAWVPISHGCNNFCSYCIVPYVRGRERSRDPQNIINEVKEAVNQGYKEVTLLGQNVNSYGKDLKDNVDFADLLLNVNEVEGLLRIRFMTSHPRDFSEKIIYALREGDKICEHIHLPLQAGSNKILKFMNRGYTREKYIETVEKIREILSYSSITTDLIVGFPGEEEEDFELTMDMVEQMRFDSAFTFVYSPRKGTKAAEMENQVPPDVKKQRITKLNEVQNKISLEENEKLLGTVEGILVEGQSKNDPEMYTGRTRTNKIVHFASGEPEENLVGKLIKVKITGAKPWNLTGEYIKDNINLHEIKVDDG